MKTLIAGIGSTILGDDGVGVHGARAMRDYLESAQKGDVDVVEMGTAGLALLDIVDGYERLIVLDAIVTGAPPGTVHVLKGDDVARAVHLGAGHEADLPTTLAMGRKLMKGHMPKEVMVIAVEALNLTAFSEQLTKEVKAGLKEALKKVETLL